MQCRVEQVGEERIRGDKEEGENDRHEMGGDNVVLTRVSNAGTRSIIFFLEFEFA